MTVRKKICILQIFNLVIIFFTAKKFAFSSLCSKKYSNKIKTKNVSSHKAFWLICVFLFLPVSVSTQSVAIFLFPQKNVPSLDDTYRHLAQA